MRRAVAIVSSLITGLIAAGVVALAAAPGIINQYNALCDPNFPTRCAAPDTNGKLPVTVTPGGTQDVNLTKVGGTSVSLGQAAAASSIPVVLPAATNVPVTVADAADVTLGAKADAKSTATDTTAITVMQVMKEISFMEQNPASRAVTNAGTFAVQAAQSGNWSDRIVGNAGGIMDAAGANQTAPANELITGCLYQATPGSITDGRVSQCQVDAKGNSRSVVMDAAGNARGANVTAANELTVGGSGSAGTPSAAVVTVQGATSMVPVFMAPQVATISTSVTRPSDANAYTAGDALANSTSSPTVGGFTFTSACRASGGFGTITDAVVSDSGKTAYTGEIWIFDQATTAINDNAVFDVSTANVLNVVGVIPFTINSGIGSAGTSNTTSLSYITGLNIGYTCVGTANLRFLVKITNAPTPVSGEVLQFRIKVNN